MKSEVSYIEFGRATLARLGLSWGSCSAGIFISWEKVLRAGSRLLRSKLVCMEMIRLRASSFL